VVKRPDGSIGIPVFTPAQLRHTNASLALEAGEDLLGSRRSSGTATRGRAAASTRRWPAHPR